MQFSTVNPFPALFDLGRVEVLRGPQGTLFGAGSEGGTVRFITPEPGLHEYTGYARSEFVYTDGGAPSYELGGAVDGPISDGTVGFRLSASYRKDGGWMDRVNWNLDGQGNPVATGVAFGIAGALLASWLGDRRGRLLPIGLGAALTVGAVMPLLARFGVMTFVGSAIVYNFVWNLSLAFQYSTVNAVDRSGRGVAAAPAFHAAGAAAGPAVAAFLIGPGNFRPVIFLVVASVLLSYGCFQLATRSGRTLAL